MDTTRRGFLGLLCGLPLLAHRAPAAPLRDYTLDEFWIAGFQFHEGPQVIQRLRAGQSLRLVTEPDNPHDDHAVRIEAAGRHLGYVPRARNRHVFRLLQQGAPVRCVAAGVDPVAPPWQAVWIRLVLPLPG